ncbi:hypothetical protein RJ641_024651 [Dillenia turbinata]|uniref:Uncharacterized protein n=1 Tax=Dillenia turbinata TaxID=194707 RepID=A0AAN8W5B6_9MAGN
MDWRRAVLMGNSYILKDFPSGFMMWCPGFDRVSLCLIVLQRLWFVLRFRATDASLRQKSQVINLQCSCGIVQIQLLHMDLKLINMAFHALHSHQMIIMSQPVKTSLFAMACDQCPHIVLTMTSFFFNAKCHALFSSGKYLVSVGAPQDRYICLWNLHGGVLVRKLRACFLSSVIASVCFSSDAKYIATAGKKHLRLWTIGSPKACESSRIYALTDLGVLCLLNSELSIEKSADLKHFEASKWAQAKLKNSETDAQSPLFTSSHQVDLKILPPMVGDGGLCVPVCSEVQTPSEHGRECNEKCLHSISKTTSETDNSKISPTPSEKLSTLPWTIAGSLYILFVWICSVHRRALIWRKHGSRMLHQSWLWMPSGANQANSLNHFTLVDIVKKMLSRRNNSAQVRMQDNHPRGVRRSFSSPIQDFSGQILDQEETTSLRTIEDSLFQLPGKVVSESSIENLVDQSCSLQRVSARSSVTDNLMDTELAEGSNRKNCTSKVSQESLTASPTWSMVDPSNGFANAIDQKDGIENLDSSAEGISDQLQSQLYEEAVKLLPPVSAKVHAIAELAISDEGSLSQTRF